MSEAVPPNNALAAALYARVYRLLADRPEFLTADRQARLDAAWTSDAPGCLCLVDRVLIGRLADVDLMCGYAVAKLRTGASSTLLDVLGCLDAERVVGMYLALPARRRLAVMRDPVWAYRVRHADLPAIREAAAFWADMPDGQVPPDMSAEAQSSYFDLVRGVHQGRTDVTFDDAKEDA
jgi:hypothetical protein